MKLIVVSDTHGRYDRLARLMDMHKDADALIFLGDGLNDLSRADAYSYPFSVYAVKGNCDGISFFSLRPAAEDEMTLTFEGYKFFVIHGHTRSVKNNMDRAILASRTKGADVLLYGHTHVATDRYIPEGEDGNKPLRLFNPGSLGASGDGEAHFGLIEIRNGNILTSLGVLKK